MKKPIIIPSKTNNKNMERYLHKKLSEIDGEGEDSGGKSPYVGENGHWFEWDTQQKKFVDTGVSAQGPQGEQGNTGSSVDYPYELVNNLTTNDSTKGLSAAQGVVLDGKVSQLEAEVDGLEDGLVIPQYTLENGKYITDSGVISNYSSLSLSSAIHLAKGETIVVHTEGNLYAIIAEDGPSPMTVLVHAPSVNPGQGVAPEYSYTANNDIDVRVSVSTTHYSIHKKWYIVEDIEELEAEVSGKLDAEAVTDPQWLWVITDKDGKLLGGIKKDGGAEWMVGVPTPVKEYINEIASTKEDKVTGKSLINTDFANAHFSIESPEYLELKTDADGKILSYRDLQGILHENAGISTNYLALSEEGLTRFKQELKASGFLSGVCDWSNNKKLHIPEPACALLNFTNIVAMPSTKTDNAHAILEFWDMAGNYFKKEVIANAQGRSSLSHPKKNISIDFCNNNGWDDGDTFSLQIGSWIPQDSFHLKAFYNDPFRCLCPVGYKLFDEITKTRGELEDYVWKKALVDAEDITPTSTGQESADDATTLWNTGARCFPDGFPCIVYLNGDFYGIFSWQLKKHRDNYRMSKKKTNNIHLDGIISLERILNANGDSSLIWWTTNSPEGVEIRNPKPKKSKDGWDLLIMDGTKYDADENGGELIDDSSPNWDANDQSCVKTKQVKDYILNLSTVIPTLESAYSTYQSSSKTEVDKNTFKQVFETYFDVDNLIDYLIFSDLLANYDGFSQNVQWVTYDGVKWYLCPYDLDGIMGNWWQLNDTIVEPRVAHYNYAQFQYLPVFYNSELGSRYAELRRCGILTANHICSLVIGWINRLGNKETFELEWEKWPAFIKNDNIHRLYKWLVVSISNMDQLYGYNN